VTAETDARLIYMANQIGRNFAAIGHDHAVAATADHLVRYWDPRMKGRIAELAAELVADGSGRLEPIAAAAVAQLAQRREPPPQTRATHFADAARRGCSDAG